MNPGVLDTTINGEERIMRNHRRRLAALLILMGAFLWNSESTAQTRVIRALSFEQITHFDAELSIASMKISAQGNKIVFSTSGPAVKVFTITVDGTGLTQIFDFERTGFGPSVDISGDGSRIVWCDGYGELYSAFSGGTDVRELATLMPHPNPIWSDFEPEIPLPPRITLDGSRIFFINAIWDPEASGVWRIDSDGTDLKQIFNYLELSREAFGSDGSEYDRGAAFSDGFSISADGSTMIFGNRLFKIGEGDYTRGHAVVLQGIVFYRLGEYAAGTQPFATDADGDRFFMFRREANITTGEDEINIYRVPLGTGDPVKLIGGLSILAASRNVQLALSGSLAIVQGGMGTPYQPPITLVDAVSESHLDLVNVDGASLKLGNFRMSLATLPSITDEGDVFCFLAPSIPQQIWICRLSSDAVNLEPSITSVELNPGFVSSDHTTLSTFKAHVESVNGPIQSVQFSAFRDGTYRARALTSNFPFTFLMDNGTFGDAHSDDGIFTNNNIRKDLPETPNGSYTVRIDATDGIRITAVDAEPFSIRDVENGISAGETGLPDGFHLYGNHPNPFNPATTIAYRLPAGSWVSVIIHDFRGRTVRNLIHERQDAGIHSVAWDGMDEDGRPAASGIYIYRIETEDIQESDKMILIR
jgi:hypothetical protein